MPALGTPLLSVEPLATFVKKEKAIRGIEQPGGAVNTIIQFADDTTITVKNMQSVKKVMECFEIYGRASGAKINIDKSEIMFIGKTTTGDCDFAFKRAEKHIKILGVYLGIEEIEARDLMWTGVLNKMKHNKCMETQKIKAKR